MKEKVSETIIEEQNDEGSLFMSRKQSKNISQVTNTNSDSLMSASEIKQRLLFNDVLFENNKLSLKEKAELMGQRKERRHTQKQVNEKVQLVMQETIKKLPKY